MMPLAQTVKRIRIELSYDQSEFAKLIGVTQQAISSYEKGLIKPRMKTIRRMKEVADLNKIPVTIEDFIDD